VDKVLFASDYPSTTNIAAQIAWLRDLLLTPEEQTLIFGENAIKLLSI
jgi:predicted TIM-barrel fold metal-dependent hydrolase